MKLLEIVKKFNGKKIVVIGDVMLDRYLWGDVSRISPEAPVPVVLMKKESCVPGGAANTAANVASLGGECSVIGVVGTDETAQKLRQELSLRKIDTKFLAFDAQRPTTQKTRVMGNRQQLARLDKEKRTEISGNIEDDIIKNIKTAALACDVFIVSDYAKGVLTKKVAEAVHEASEARKIPIISDGKPRNKESFRNSYLLTPNRKEAYIMAGASEKQGIEDVGGKLAHDMNSNVLITLSEEGMILFEKIGKATRILTKAREVFDVSGAGDTAVAASALSIAAGADLVDACKIGNYAAGIVVGKLGTTSTNTKELEQAIKDDE